jgi:hypothetical protein
MTVEAHVTSTTADFMVAAEKDAIGKEAAGGK